jgi:hypothetical protein
MHSILWVSVGVSAGVAIITTVLIDFLFKPGLEARKERILEKKRDKRNAIKGIWQAYGLLGQLQLNKNHAPYKNPEQYLHTATEQVSQKVDAAFDVLKIPDSVGGPMGQSPTPRTLGFRGVLGRYGSCVPCQSLSLFSQWRRWGAGIATARVSRRGWRAVPRSAAPGSGAVPPSLRPVPGRG